MITKGICYHTSLVLSAKLEVLHYSLFLKATKNSEKEGTRKGTCQMNFKKNTCLLHLAVWFVISNHVRILNGPSVPNDILTNISLES